MSKVRLDIYLTENGYFETRQKAKAEIMAGNILVDNIKTEKAGTLIKEDSVIKVLEKKFPYVSRGALKLKKGLEAFKVSVQNKVALDIGASTGGFTEILLLNGAAKVYSVDVGYNQLAWSLRQSPKVIVLEKTNGRNLTPENLENSQVDIAVTDVSFISLDKILPAAYGCLKGEGEMIALIKPQFEAGKDGVNKKGVITDPQVHIEVITKIVAVSEAIGFSVLALASSPLKGPKGNREYLIHFKKEATTKNRVESDIIKGVVTLAFAEI